MGGWVRERVEYGVVAVKEGIKMECSWLLGALVLERGPRQLLDVRCTCSIKNGSNFSVAAFSPSHSGLLCCVPLQAMSSDGQVRSSPVLTTPPLNFLGPWTLKNVYTGFF